MFVQPYANSELSLIPRDVLLREPDKFKVTISPDGKNIAFLASQSGLVNIWIAKITDPAMVKCITNNQYWTTINYHWSYSSNQIFYIQENRENRYSSLFYYELQTNITKLLTPQSDSQVIVYKISHKKPNEIVIGLKNKKDKYYNLYKLNLINLKKEPILQNSKFNDFIIDYDLQVRFAWLINNRGDKEYYVLKDNKWNFFIKIPLVDLNTTRLLDFDKTGELVYFLDCRDRNTTALKSINLISGSQEVLLEDECVDISHILTTHPINKTIQAMTLVYDKATYHILDNDIKADIEYLLQANPGNLFIESRTLDDRTWLIVYETDINPIKFYLYDRNQRKVKLLFSDNKNLEKFTLSPMFSVVIKSRDDLELLSYITFPNDIVLNKLRPSKLLPMVINVHSDPWLGRNYWGLNREDQWLANRGYVVLSVNFRGSAGFGKKFTNEGNRQWGRKMQTDLIDAVNWAISNQIADPKRIAIIGRGYGGYAAISGLTLTPDVFACAITLGGPVSLLTYIESIPPVLQNVLKMRIGRWDSAEEKAALNQQSPLVFIDNIKKPLLIAHGASDKKVKEKEIKYIRENLDSKHIPIIYAMYQDDSHNLNSENKLSYYALVENFLAEFLGGRAEPLEPFKQNSLFYKKNNIFED